MSSHPQVLSCVIFSVFIILRRESHFILESLSSICDWSDFALLSLLISLIMGCHSLRESLSVKDPILWLAQLGFLGYCWVLIALCVISCIILFVFFFFFWNRASYHYVFCLKTSFKHTSLRCFITLRKLEHIRKCLCGFHPATARRILGNAKPRRQLVGVEPMIFRCQVRKLNHWATVYASQV